MSDTCEFGRFDEVGDPIEVCQRTDYEQVDIGDDAVRLCPKHRHWAAALGVDQTVRALIDGDLEDEELSRLLLGSALGPEFYEPSTKAATE